MEEFSSLIEAQQQSKTVEVSSAEDLDSLRSFLQKKPTGRGNVFVQTRDIVVSPYSYQYQEESGRTAIYYEGKAEAYYDAKADVYYADPTTKTAISYTWKTQSFAPIGTDSDSTDPSWSYEGNGYKIEGIYQNRLKRSAWKSAGLFYNAKKISGVFVKNYFGYGKNVTSPAPDKKSQELIYEQNNYEAAFRNDLAKAKHSVVIAVPKVKFKYKTSILSALANLLHNGVSVVVHVKEEGANEIELSNAGMDVVCNKEQTLQCAVIDKAIVWYGNINFFGYNSETNNVMRIADYKIANEMMEILYSATENKVNGG